MRGSKVGQSANEVKMQEDIHERYHNGSITLAEASVELLGSRIPVSEWPRVLKVSLDYYLTELVSEAVSGVACCK